MTRVDAFTCREAFQRLEDYVDRELAPDELERVERHLEVCEICAREFDFETDVVQAIREKLRRVELPVGLADRITRLIELERRKP